MVGGEHRQRGGLRGDRPGSWRQERQQARLGDGAARRDEEQPPMPKKPLRGNRGACRARASGVDNHGNPQAATADVWAASHWAVAS